jgi:hypothetical protein
MTLLHGFDVSAFQGDTVPTCDFVFVKATEGSGYTSSKFAAQWASARTHAKVRGAYHFARPEQSGGASQADRLLAVARTVPGEMLCLDLEASELGQSATNAWAKEFGDRLRAKAPGVTTVLYMGSGYATNGTGRDLSRHFDWWWYPQYPSTAHTSTWRTSFSPWVPGGLTSGWKAPHIWQWTDDFTGLDASISPLTINQLAGSGGSKEDDVPEYISLGLTKPQSVRAGQVANVVFDHEYSDTGHSHADGPHPGILSGGENGTQFVIEVDVAHLTGSWRLVETDPAKDYAVTKTYPTQNADGRPATQIGWCSAGQHLYVEVHPSADSAVSVAAKAHYWRR